MKQDLIPSPKEPRMQPQPPGELSQSDGELSDDFDNEEEAKAPIGSSASSSQALGASQQKNLRELARKLWLSVEKGDKMGIMNILQSNDK